MADNDNSRILKPVKFGTNPQVGENNVTDKFGQKYNADADDSKWSGQSPADSRKYHSRADTDTGPNSFHHTLGPKRNQASPGNHTHDGTTSKKLFQSDTVPISFTAQPSHIQVVVFDEPYPAGVIPVVTTNINSSASETVRWGSRAYIITNVGFSLFLFKGAAVDSNQTWVDIPVQWRSTP